MPVRTGPRYPLAVSRGQQFAYIDAYARASATRVLVIEPADAPAVLLDRTVFYPGGGGQPPDTLDLRADGGTHVANTREVGPIA
jgi:Ser-tRNA(Ala) deacylase AlaX